MTIISIISKAVYHCIYHTFQVKYVKRESASEKCSLRQWQDNRTQSLSYTVTYITEAVRENIQRKASRFTSQSCFRWINSRLKVAQQTRKHYLVHFFLVFGEVDWNTLDADIRFSMYCPRTWFSERNFKFSSFTLSTRCDKSVITSEHYYRWHALVMLVCELHIK